MMTKATSAPVRFRFVIWLDMALGIAAVTFLTGCVGAVPRPVSVTKVEYGHRLKSADVAFIQPGVTTCTEVIARLGTNYTILPQHRAIAYSWEMKGGGGIWWWSWSIPLAFGAFDADAGTWEGGWRAFFVAFDEHTVVRATAFKSPSTRHSLHEHLYEWERKMSASPCHAPVRSSSTKRTPAP